MTTAAPFPHPLPPSADEMDLHSDDGFDFGDGDIDLDLGDAPTAPAVQHQDDGDVAIADAASVSGENVEPVAADQDDFMVDNADYAEEDHAYQGDDAVMTTAEPSDALTATAPAQDFAPAPTPTLTQDYFMPPRTVAPEDDLLDYSEDDDFEQSTPSQGLSGPSGGEHPTIHTYGSKHYDGENTNTGEASVQSRANSHDTHQSEAHNEEHDEADGEEGGVELQDDGSFAEDDEHEHSDHGVSHDDHDHAATAADGEHQHNESSDLQPVTVNYAGNELWLFKHHDTEETGDWLLEDISLASASMADLFRACRASLGDDVSNEHEIGLRFDHLHNLELYEDNTACVAVSLQRLVGLYHTLQQQDENTEPEYFYCSLLFRPRFATLLSDIAKYADQGSGYSGLDAAVSAGETHFSNVISGASTEHEQTDWEEEEQEGVDKKESGEYEAQQNIDASEYEDQDEQEAHTGYEEEQDQQEDDGQDHDDASHASVSHQEQVPNTADVSHEDAGADTASLSQQKSPGQLGAYTPRSQSKEDAEAEARREKQEEEDLLEYSDDEEETEEAQHVNTNGPSASSSTVQGDETATAEDSTKPADDLARDDQSGEHDEADFHDEHEGDNQFNDQLLEGIDDTAQSYQNYDQAFDHNDPFQGFPAEGDANQDYSGFEYGALDQQLPLDFLDGAEFNAGAESAAAMNDFTGTDDFLDLNNTSDWVTEQEPTSNLADENGTAQDDEDDAVESPAAAVSSAAIPVATSSTGGNIVSPQGQKRSVDEAGHGGDDALDSIDAKRPRV